MYSNSSIQVERVYHGVCLELYISGCKVSRNTYVFRKELISVGEILSFTIVTFICLGLT